MLPARGRPPFPMQIGLPNLLPCLGRHEAPHASLMPHGRGAHLEPAFHTALGADISQPYLLYRLLASLRSQWRTGCREDVVFRTQGIDPVLLSPDAFSLGAKLKNREFKPRVAGILPRPLHQPIPVTAFPQIQMMLVAPRDQAIGRTAGVAFPVEKIPDEINTRR